jgi:hypothetical protein
VSAPPPFDRTDLPQHTRVVGAPVTTAYAAVTDVARWPTWVPQVREPVIAKGTDHFLFRADRDGRLEHHEGHVIVRGPTHTFGIEVGDGRLWFRTRPDPLGTRVDVVLEPPGGSSLRTRVGGRRRRVRQQEWLVAVLDGLATHVGAA